MTWLNSLGFWQQLAVVLAAVAVAFVPLALVISAVVHTIEALPSLVAQGIRRVIGRVRSKKENEEQDGTHQGLGARGDEKATQDAGGGARGVDDFHRVLASGGLDAQQSEAGRQTAGASSAGASNHSATSQRTGYSASAPRSRSARPPEGLSLHERLAWLREHEG